MKVLNCVHSLDPAGGGPAQLIGQLLILQHITDEIEVEAACLDPPDAPWLKDMEASKVHALGPGFLKFGYSPRFLPFIKGCRDFDLIVVHGLWQYHAMAVWLALKHTSRPYVVFPHGMLDPWFNERYPLKHLKKALYWWLIQYRILRDAKLVLFTAEEERILAARSFSPYHCKEYVLGLGTKEPDGDADSQIELFFKQYPQLKGKRILLFLSRIHEKKGCDLLLEAFASLVKDYEDLHLVMAGPCADDYAQRLKEQFSLHHGAHKERITWTGMMVGDRKWGALRAADAFILPSHQENFGQAVSEALSCNTPVLISRKINIWREIQEDGAGLVASDTLAGTFELLNSWLNISADDRETMRSKARLCYEKRFQFKSFWTRYLSIVKEVAG